MAHGDRSFCWLQGSRSRWASRLARARAEALDQARARTSPSTSSTATTSRPPRSRSVGSSSTRKRPWSTARGWPTSPHRPDVDVVDVRDRAAAGEGRVGPRRHGRPAQDLVAIEREHADRPARHQLGAALATLGSAQRGVLLRRDPVAQAPADVRVGPLRTQYRGDVLEPGCGTHLDRHAPTVPGWDSDGVYGHGRHSR